MSKQEDLTLSLIVEPNLKQLGRREHELGRIIIFGGRTVKTKTVIPIRRMRIA
jgi:hypothetical protein